MKEDNKSQRVKLIHSVYLSHKNGANTVIRLLLDSKERFKKNRIEIEGLFPSETFRVSSPKGGFKSLLGKLRGALISYVRKQLTKASQRSERAVRGIIYLNEQHAAKQIVNKYLGGNRHDEDTVFFHTFFTCYYYLRACKHKQNIVLILHTNGEPFKMERIYYPALENSKFFQELLEMERFVLSQVDRVSFVSKASMDSFLQHHPYVDSNKVFYIYNGVENKPTVTRDVHQEGPIEVCCVASITPRKGQHYIVEALEEMQNKPNVHFTFVGDGSDKVNLEERVQRNNLRDYITFTGVSNEVEKYLNKSDIYILPSEDEGLPMAILEAMRASLPIVSTPVGGIPELITEGYNGIFITPSKDGVKDFLNKIDIINWRTMGENSRKLFEEKFVVEKMVDGYSRLLTF